MVAKSFEIFEQELEPFEPYTRRLLVELCPRMTSVILWNKLKQAPEAVEVFNGTLESETDWEAMKQQSKLISLTGIETRVSLAFPEAITIPTPIYTPQSGIRQLNVLYGEMDDSFVGGDLIGPHQMMVAWRLPGWLHRTLTEHFKMVRISHLISGMVEQMDTKDGDEIVAGRLIISQPIAWVFIWKGTNLQFAGSFPFMVPEDLSYHLLNTCRQLSVDPSVLDWQVAGMVETSSPTWTAVSKFFNQVEPLHQPVKWSEELSSHYFAHLYSGLI